ncbi:MAG: ATP-binding protein [Litorimonas sp.]
MVNSLTNYEVSIIKNLLGKPNFKNQEIAGLINRSRGDAKSDVSSGRISNIKNDQIQKYKNIDACSDKEVETFLENAKNLKILVSTTDNNPISNSMLEVLFPSKSTDTTKLNITETDQIECKLGFNIVMKTIAAFANNKGGYFAFGVKDKTWDVVGLNPAKLKKFQEFDLKDINQKIRTALGADLQVQKAVYRIENKFVGIMYIAEAKIKPLIFTKSDGKEGFAEGHIYYRYSGEDRLIAPLDLQNIIEVRIRDLSKTILTKHISQILDAGPTNSAVLNLETGEVDGASGKFVIDEKLLKEIEFIKEGEFQEKSGKPTLKLVGELTQTTGVKTVTSLGNITNHNLMMAFLNQETVENSVAFVKHLSFTQTQWLPIYYFMKMANIDRYNAQKLIAEAVGSLKGSVKFQTLRIKEGKLPPKGGQADAKYIQLLKAGSTFEIGDMSKQEKRCLLRSIQSLSKYDCDLSYILGILKLFYPDEFNSDKKYTYKSMIRATISYVDATYFR